MDVLDLARWQFGITTVYHFLVVPITIGLGILVAGMHTAWHRTGNPRWKRMTKFWGRIYLANFALGVATGLVQEFQFGLSWSEYSRFVGDVFGSLLAMEALLAFFVESTFLGLWIFGADRLPRRVHLATIWLAVGASILSAYFIIAANSWMQHPVGVTVVDGRPRLDDIGAVLTNNTAIAAFSHAIAGSLVVAGSLAVAVGVYHLLRRSSDEAVWRSSVRIGGIVSIAAFAALLVSGDVQGKLMYQQQPLKMSAAEALCETSAPAPLSVFAIGKLGGECDDVTSWTVPGLLSFLAHGDFSSEVPGVKQVQQEYEQSYGATYPDSPWLGPLAGAPIEYEPMLEVTYWGFRLMIAGGALSALVAAWALWATRRGRRPSRWLGFAGLAALVAPLAGNAAGWIFTEMGRQPFVVVPNPDVPLDQRVWFFTAQAVSPGLSMAEVLTSLIALTAVYGVLAAIEVWLILRFVRGGTGASSADPPVDGPAPRPRPANESTSDDDVLTFAY